MQTVPHISRIRSFVRREGRITAAQQRALQELLPIYGIEVFDQKIDLHQVFGRQAPLTLEIGFGDGMALAEMARHNLANDYLGIEVHRPGVGRLLNKLAEEKLINVRVICDDAMRVLQTCLANQALDGIYLFFPDPWPKKRHHKRRLVQTAFVDQVHRVLKVGGCIHMATDWQDYADQMLSLFSQTKGFLNTAGVGQFIPRPDYRPLTKFEQRGQRLGHGVWDLIFRRTE